MIDTIVIDFGTSRTKAAYYNPKSQRPTLIRLGERDYVPSVFYVEKGGNILFGDSAQQVLENQEIKSYNNGVPIYGLKLALSRKHRRRGNGYSAVALLTPLFTYIRERAANLEGFDKAYPTKVVLTTTKWYRPSDREALQRAAQNAGFEDITLIAEPESVAKGWIAATEPDRADVIVLDCGGGTVDWTYLHREKGGFRMVLPGDAHKVGGHSVDKALARIFDPQLKSDPRLLNKVSAIKEMFCNDVEEYPPISIGSQSVKLEGDQIEQAIYEAFINPVCDVIEPFIEEVKKATRRESPAILLVGGSAKLRGLKCKLEAKFKCEVNPDWPDAEYAPVLGAVPIPSSSGQAPTEGLERQEEGLNKQVAGHFLDVAKLIGEPQDSEVEFVVGEETHRVVPGLLMSGTVVEKLLDRANRLNQGSLQLTVLGDVNAGKSTLINAMLGQNLLPTGEGACTSVPTEIVYGLNGDRAMIVKEDGKIIRSISFKAFKKDYYFKPSEQPKLGADSERPDRFEGIQYVQLESESTFCKKGIRIVDSLGIDSDELSNDITRRFIMETDVLLVVVKDILSESTRDFIEEFVKKKVVSHYQYVFFVLQDRGHWDEYVDTGQRKGAEEILRNQVEECNFDCDNHLFTVNARQAFYARTMQEYQHKLETSGIVKFEEGLLKFMEGTGRIFAVVEAAVGTDFISALDEAKQYIRGKQEFLDRGVVESKQVLGKAKEGRATLRKMATTCQDIVRKFLADTQDEIIARYREKMNSALTTTNFGKFWHEENLDDDLKKNQSLRGKIEDHIKSCSFSAIEELNEEFPLGKMIEDSFSSITREFFDTLDKIGPYQTSVKGLLSGDQRLDIRLADAFSGDFNLPHIFLKGAFKWWDPALLFIPTLHRWSKNVDAIDDVSEQIRCECLSKLLDSRNTKKIERSVHVQIKGITDVLANRLNAEIKIVERQLADADNQARDKVVEKKRLEKIDFLLTAKCDEISRVTFGKGFDPKELWARVTQSR